MLVLLAVFGFALSLINGCGGGSSGSKQNVSTVTVTATSESLKQTTSILLTID
jgi:hypothetical protein